MSDIPSTRMDAARSHYPLDFRTNQAIPYRQVITSNSQVHQCQVENRKYEVGSLRLYLLSTFYSLLATSYEYSISATFTRQHCNPPIWHDYHYHDFQVTLVVSAPCTRSDLYGVDMVEAENILKSVIASIPQKINQLPSCPNGTTEQLCNYFRDTVKFSDRQIKIKSVSVSETANRITCMRQKAEGRWQMFLLATFYLLLATYLLINYV